MTVYFVTQKGRDDGPVKIGTTADLDRRLAGLQTGHHEELEVVATISGGRETESYLHEVLAASRIRGEWFQRTPEVDAAIARAGRLGAPSLPIADVGIAPKSVAPSSDVSVARTLVRDLISRRAPAQTLSSALAIVCRGIRKTCPSMTVRRLRALYNGESRRVDAFEMAALQKHVDEARGLDQAKNDLILAPILSDYLEEVGAPLTGDQAAIVDRYLRRCADAVAAGDAR